MVVAGNVGVGTNAPQAKVHINGGGTNTVAIQISQTDTNPPANSSNVKGWIGIKLDNGQTYKAPLYQ